MIEISFDAQRCIRCGSCVKTCAMGHLRMTDDGPAAVGRGACMGCMQCAAICPRQAVLKDGRSAVVSRPENDLEGLIMSRRSIRRYRPEAPDKSIIQWAIERSAYAPSGKNRHDNRFTVVYGKTRVEAVRSAALEHCRQTGEAPEIARFLEKGLDLLTCNAPVLILGWSPDDCLNPTVDVAVAMETVELLLVSRGLGTCWGGYMRQLTNHSPALKAMLGIGEGCSLQACLMTGLPEGPAFVNIPDRRGADIYWA